MMPPEIELRSHGEETPVWEDLDAQNTRLRKLNEDFFEGIDREQREQIELYRRECNLLLDEIEENGLTAQLSRDNPSNLAINATEVSLSTDSNVREQRFDQHCEILFAQPTEAIEGMPSLRRQVVEGHDRLAPTGQQGFSGARLVLFVSLGLVLVAGLAVLIDRTSSHANAEKRRGTEDRNNQLPELNRRAELTSLLIQAAADKPVDTARYNISPERFQAMRQTLLAVMQNLTEEQYWEQLAVAAEAGYGANAQPYTLGDHFYGLDLAFTLLEPLVDPQPCELDLTAWIPELCKEWQSGESEQPGGGVPRVYRSITNIVAEDSGATRLTRLFLARAVLAQVALKAGNKDALSPDSKPSTGQPLTSTTLAGRANLGSSISWGSIFQISGAAMFCLPPPFMAYGYLANTILEVFCGGADSSGSFFNGLAEAIATMKRDIEQIKITELFDDLGKIKDPINAYKQSLENKWNELPDDKKEDPDQLPGLDFFDDPNPTEFQQSLRGRLEQFFNAPKGSLEDAVNAASDMWDNRQAYDPKGEWSLLMWRLLAYTSYLSCSRQLTSTYAMIANLRGNTNHQKLADRSWSGDYRPDPSVLLTGDGDGSQLAYWSSKHWSQVRSHIKLVKSPYVWSESLRSKRTLVDARLSTENNRGYYDQLWFTFVDTWRRAELTLSMPTEIYRWCKRETDGISAGKVYDSRAFAHGWVTSRRTSDNENPIDAHDDLLPPSGHRETPGTQQWLLAWYQEMSDLHTIAWLDDKTDRVNAEDQCMFVQKFKGIFTIGRHKPKWTYFLLQTIRKQLQAWRLQDSVKVDPSKGFVDPSRLHGAAWPTTGELSRIVKCLDQAVPCSWQAGPDYLNQVLMALKDRWEDMANSGTDPSHLWWANDENKESLKYWWRDRRNADQRPMPLLPETIALILEVWLAGAIKADQLQKPLRDYLGPTRNEGEFIVHYLHNLNCELTADDGNNQGRLAYQLPASIEETIPYDITGDIPNDKDEYDKNRDLIRNCWVRKREETLDNLLISSYGLQPSKAEAGESESTVQNWLNGLLDESLNDDLKLQKPTIKITDIQAEPGLEKPTIGAALWKEGASVKYSYQLRGMSSFQATGNDQLSEESEFSSPLILDEAGAASGVAILVPRDALLLARQFLVYRTLTDADDPKKQTKTWIGSGHFDPGQLEAAIFHDGHPPVPEALDTANISIDPTSKPPKGVSAWSVGNKVQYRLQYLDAVGTGQPTEPSALSDPFEISNAACGLKLSIASDPLGIATSVQVQRQIIDPTGIVLEKLKPIALHAFPVSSHPGVRLLTLIDGDTAPPPSPVIVKLQMTTKGLELRRSDQANPVWSSANNQSSGKDMASCRMQLDGNLVIYDKDWKAYWASNTMESAGKTNSRHALRLRANGELAIVNSINENQVLPGNNNALIHSGDAQLSIDRPDVFLRSGELMLPGQELSIDNQSPQPHTAS